MQATLAAASMASPALVTVRRRASPPVILAKPLHLEVVTDPAIWHHQVRQWHIDRYHVEPIGACMASNLTNRQEGRRPQVVLPPAFRRSSFHAVSRKAGTVFSIQAVSVYLGTARRSDLNITLSSREWRL